MFKKIARISVDQGWSVVLGYDIPEVITSDTKLEVSTRFVNDDAGLELDPNSEIAKQLESVSEVLKIGFNIGCAYTMEIIEQSTRVGNKLMTDDIPANANVTGSTSDLIVE